jgi:predicted  nucleic acid-binding Zn-ribbon protein
MRVDIDAAIERVAAIRTRLAQPAQAAVPLDEIEDALSEGYAQALACDAWLIRADQRVRELIDDTSRTVSGRELRALTGEHGDVQRELVALRRELAALRDEHERLRLLARTRAR